MVLPRIVKPKTQSAKRALERREPKLHENDKKTLFVRGGHTSELITQVLTELFMLKKPEAVMYRRKNIMRPFEDETQLEFFSNKNDSSLFLFGSHSKKRPNNLVLGRLFDSHILDMIELGVSNYKSFSEFTTSKPSVGTKPCLMFVGDPFNQDHEFRRLKNMLIDFFRGPVVDNIRLQGLEHVLQFTAAEGKVYVRSYRILLKKSGSRTPRIELEEMGPSLDLEVRRTKLASDDLYKRSKKQPLAAKIKKRKNVSRDAFGTKHGRIHMTKQDLDKLQTRKMKGLKRNAPKTKGDVPNKRGKKTEEKEDS